MACQEWEDGSSCRTDQFDAALHDFGVRLTGRHPKLSANHSCSVMAIEEAPGHFAVFDTFDSERIDRRI
jgi:hypothetical protein